MNEGPRPRGEPRTALSNPCLDADQAAAFAAGQLSVEALESVEEHIDRCAVCRRLLSNVAELARSRRTLLSPEDRSGTGGAPDAEFFRAGAVVGRYIVGPPLGAGAMGIVYLAHDPELDRKVALKVIRAGLLHHPQRGAEGLLRREAQAVARLSHPNVVSVYDLIVEDETLFVAMEFVPGVTLGRWLREETRSWREVLDAFVLAGRGLEAAHGVGIVHRDFKPENVLYGSDGRVCLSDFGLSQLQKEGTPDAPSIAGTPRYMAPEQRRGEAATARSDQYSFCVAFFEGIHGEHPFAKEPQQGRTRRHTPRRSPPGWLTRCVRRGLRENPDDRYPAMSDLLAELTRHRGSQGRRAAVALLAVGAALAGMAAFRHAQHQRHEVCAHADEDVAGAWDAPGKAAVSAAFENVGTPYARRARERVESGLERYAHQWADARTQTCEAALTHEPPADVPADAQMLCLDQRLREMRTLTSEISKVTKPQDVSAAVVAVESMRPVEACQRASAPRNVAHYVARSPQAALAERVEGDLAAADVLTNLGRAKEATGLAEHAMTGAQTLGDQELLAQALLRQNFFLGARQGDLARSLDNDYRAVAAADAAGDDSARVHGWAYLLFDLKFAKPDPAATARAYEQGMAVVQRMGGDEELEALLHRSYGVVLGRQRRFDEARQQIARAVESFEHLGQLGHLCTTLTNLALVDLAAGDLDGASRTLERNLPLARAIYGEPHPSAANILNNLASTDLERRDFARGLERAQQAVAIFAETGADTPDVVGARDTVGLALIELGRFDEAVLIFAALVDDPTVNASKGWQQAELENLGRAYLGSQRTELAAQTLERAIALGEPLDPFYLADAQWALARALSQLGRDAKRATSLARAAGDAFDTMGTLSPWRAARRDDIRAWLGAGAYSRTGLSRPL